MRDTSIELHCLWSYSSIWGGLESCTCMSSNSELTADWTGLGCAMQFNIALSRAMLCSAVLCSAVHRSAVPWYTVLHRTLWLQSQHSRTRVRCCTTMCQSFLSTKRSIAVWLTTLRQTTGCSLPSILLCVRVRRSRWIQRSFRMSYLRCRQCRHRRHFLLLHSFALNTQWGFIEGCWLSWILISAQFELYSVVWRDNCKIICLNRSERKNVVYCIYRNIFKCASRLLRNFCFDQSQTTTTMHQLKNGRR